MIYFEIQRDYEFNLAKEVWSNLEENGFSVVYSLTPECKCKLYIKPVDVVQYIHRIYIEVTNKKSNFDKYWENILSYFKYRLVFRNKDGDVIPLSLREFQISDFISLDPLDYTLYVFPYLSDKDKYKYNQTSACWTLSEDFKINRFTVVTGEFHQRSDVITRLAEMGFTVKVPSKEE